MMLFIEFISGIAVFYHFFNRVNQFDISTQGLSSGYLDEWNSLKSTDRHLKLSVATV